MADPSAAAPAPDPPPATPTPTPAEKSVQEVEQVEPSAVAPQSLRTIMKEFGKGTRELMRFVFIEQRSERRKELVESLRFYVTYK